MASSALGRDHVEQARPARGLTPTMDLLTTVEAAAELGLRPNTLERWRHYGGGPRFVKVGSRVRYRRRDLERWLDTRSYRRTHERAS
jgi:excisionase family DNA binding protein